MTAQDIYNKWKHQWDHDEVRTHGKFQFPEVAYELRELNHSWTSEDIAVFTDFLQQTEKKWFVANLFAIQKKIPEKLFTPFIDAG